MEQNVIHGKHEKKVSKYIAEYEIFDERKE